MKMYRLAKMFSTSLAVGGIILLAAGCGESPPLSSVEPSATPLSKVAVSKSRVVDSSASQMAENHKDILDIEGGAVGVKFTSDPKSENEVSLESARLKIAPGALGKSGQVYSISMRATAGESLDEIDILFGPAGTTFSPAATLTIVLYGKVSAEDIGAARHVYGDGQVESVQAVATDRGPKTVVEISVPGFSRYGFDDDGYGNSAMYEESEY